MQCEVHGDDFTALATQENIVWFIAALKEHWLLEVRAILGPPGTPGTVQEARLLNRVITWDSKPETSFHYPRADWCGQLCSDTLGERENRRFRK